MNALQKKKLYDTALEFLTLDGKPDFLSQSHIRDSYERYLKFCAAQSEDHLPEIYFKRVVRAHYFSEQDPKNLPARSPTDAELWDFVSRIGQEADE